MNSSCGMGGLDKGAQSAQLLLMDGKLEVVDAQALASGYAVHRRPPGDRRRKDGAVQLLVETGKKPVAPIAAQRRERGHEGVGPPVRNAGDDQMPRRGHAGDAFAMGDMAGDQL